MARETITSQKPSRFNKLNRMKFFAILYRTIINVAKSEIGEFSRLLVCSAVYSWCSPTHGPEIKCLFLTPLLTNNKSNQACSYANSRTRLTVTTLIRPRRCYGYKCSLSFPPPFITARFLWRVGRLINVLPSSSFIIVIFTFLRRCRRYLRP